MAVRWVRCLVPFGTLSKTDQQLLLQESWKELFLLNFAQWSVPWDLATLFDSPQVRERIPDDTTTCIEMKTVQEILCRFRQLSPDSSEVGCMKAVILFSPGESLSTLNMSLSNWVPLLQQKQLDSATCSPSKCFKTRLNVFSLITFDCATLGSLLASAAFFSCSHPSERLDRQQLKCYSSRKPSETYRYRDF